MTGTRPSRLSDAVSQAAYRIVQESLHQRPAPCPHGAGVDRRAASKAAGCGSKSRTPTQRRRRSRGHPFRAVGVTGMRERAIALGGTLTAGAENGRFRVHAALPYEPGR